MTMDNLSPTGRCHRTLQRLADGPCGFTLLLQATRRDGERSEKARTRLRASLNYMQRAGLVADDGRLFSITPEGRARLEELDGAVHGRPNARVFGKVAA